MATCTIVHSDVSDTETDSVYSESALSEKHQIHEGHDVQFVQKPPKEIQLECSVCLQFLSDPCHTDCECGNSFCRACIETINDMGNPCPLCNEHFQIIIPSKQLKRTLNSLQVYCPHKDEGCDWTDELGRLSDHFNATPTPESRLKGCELTLIACKYCEHLFPRREITNHEANLCPNKPYTCQYCNYSSVYNDITDNHWPLCLKFPVPCPFECGENPERQSIEVHITRECGNVPIQCDFNYVGCEDELPRKDMPVHMRDNMVEHMSLLALSHKEDRRELKTLREENLTLHAKADRELKQSLSSLQQENVTLKRRIASLETEHMTLKTESKRNLLSLQQDVTLSRRIASLEAANVTLKTESQCSVKNIRSHLCLLPVHFKMNNFRQLKRNDEAWTSPPFYTHDQGYKMCLQVEPNGSGDGYGTHLSVFGCLMKGRFDSTLTWPFRGKVTYTLLDQRLGRHITDVLEFDEDCDDYGDRVFDNDIGEGWGSILLIEYKYLPPNYLHRDCLWFEVVNVEIDT